MPASTRVSFSAKLTRACWSTVRLEAVLFWLREEKEEMFKIIIIIIIISTKCLKSFLFFPLATGKIFDGLSVSFCGEKLIEYAVSVSCYTLCE